MSQQEDDIAQEVEATEEGAAVDPRQAAELSLVSVSRQSPAVQVACGAVPGA